MKNSINKKRGGGGTRCCCCCRRCSPTFVCTRPPSFAFACSHSPALIRPHSFSCSRLCSFALPHSHSPVLVHVRVPDCVCPHSFVCVCLVVFAGSCLHALVHVCGCSCHPLSCCRSCHCVLLALGFAAPVPVICITYIVSTYLLIV